MAKAVKTYQVDITTNPDIIIITAEPVASNLPQQFPVAHVVAITPVFYDFAGVEANDTGTQFKETYPYPTMTRLIIESQEGKTLDLELQSVTNQATWNLGTAAALKIAALDIGALL